MMMAAVKEYIQFVDPEVERICIANFSSDGVGVTMQDAARVTSSQFRGKFKNNTSIVAFDEFQFFTGVDRLYEEDGFFGCTALVTVKLPPSLRQMDWGCLQYCSSLAGTFVIPASVTALGGRGTVDGTTGLTNLVCLLPSTEIFFTHSGNGTGILYTKNLTTAFRYISANYKHIVIDGDVVMTQIDWLFEHANVESIRIKGNYTTTRGAVIYWTNQTSHLAFLELNGRITGDYLTYPGAGYAANGILHLGYAGLAGTPAQFQVQDNALSKIFVGDGSSQAADQAILSLYLADPDWAAYSSKLDLWYNYNGQYKEDPVIPTN